MATYNSAYTGAEIDENLGFALDGAAKAWAKYDQTTPVVDNSYNVSSITDNGTGDFTANYTNSFSSVDYSHVTSGLSAGTSVIVGIGAQATAPSASDTTFLALRADNDAALDETYNSVAILGDLA